MIWLLNRSLFARRTIALTIATALVALFIGITMTTLASLAGGKREIDEKRRLLGRLQSFASQLPTVLSARDTPPDGEIHTFLFGNSEVAARANLQQRFNDAAIQSGVIVVSVGNAPNLEKEDITYVGLQANVTGATGDLRELLISLENATPVLFLPRLSMRSQSVQSTKASTEETPLIAQLRLYGALDPKHRTATEKENW